MLAFMYNDIYKDVENWVISKVLVQSLDDVTRNIILESLTSGFLYEEN